MKVIISKRKTLYLTICILLSFLLFLLFNSKWETSKSEFFTMPNEVHANKTPTEPLVYTSKCCTQLNNSIRTNIFFLKLHKTGSTTMQSMILRFALLNSLDIMNVIYDSYYWPLSNFSIYPETWTPNGKYNILTNHMRYDSKLKLFQYPDTSMVTLLRNPVTLFRSLFFYFRMDATSGMTFSQFLNASKKPDLWTIDSALRYRGYNQMSVDLGFDPLQNKNKTAIYEFIAKIDREFDLVMITEHMEESLVLLANLMGWPLEYVTFLKLNARHSEIDLYVLTPEDEITISELNQVDTLLYEYFLRKFRKCVQQYGEQKMKEQVQQFKMINERFKKRCVADEVAEYNLLSNSILVGYKPKKKSDLECVYSINNPPFMTDQAYKTMVAKNTK